MDCNVSSFFSTANDVFNFFKSKMILSCKIKLSHFSYFFLLLNQNVKHTNTDTKTCDYCCHKVAFVDVRRFAVLLLLV